MLKFSKANAKLEALYLVDSINPFLQGNRKVYSMDLLSGYSCPYAKDCLAKVIVEDNKRSVKDGPDTIFRCFSASQEAIYTNTYNSRKHNFDLLRSCRNVVDAMVELIQNSMPKNLGVCRIHVAGDFFSYAYMMAWNIVAKNNPGRLFYAYTKSLPFWASLRQAGIADNLVLTASYGGRFDFLIEELGLRYAKVVFNHDEAGSLEIDHDDSHAANPNTKDISFALLIHGVQPKGSEAAKAVKLLNGEGSYSRS